MLDIAVGLLILLVAGFVLALVGESTSKNRHSKGPKYNKIELLLSNGEYAFYLALKKAVGASGVVFAKVRIADVLTPQRAGSKQAWWRAFSRISQKHFDFTVCDPERLNVMYAVELDDKSHNTAKGRERDALVNAACCSAGLRLVRVKAQRGYSINALKQKIENIEVQQAHGPVTGMSFQQ